jgi:hypothetical protein
LIEPFIFYPPFHQFFHRWRKLKLEYAAEPGEDVRGEAKIMIDILLPFMTPHNVAREDIERTKLVSFEDLWLLFPPDELVVLTSGDAVSACKVRGYDISKATNNQSANTTVKLEQIDWNGRYCGFQDSKITLESYSGPKHVTELEVYPLRLAPNKEHVEQQLLVRGQKFAGLRGFQVKRCVGHKYVSRYESTA